MPAQGDGPNLGGAKGRIKRMSVKLEARMAGTLGGGRKGRLAGPACAAGHPFNDPIASAGPEPVASNFS